DQCEPLGAPADVACLFRRTVVWGKKRGWRTLELRGGRQSLSHAPASLTYYGHSLDLTIGEQRLFENFDGSARQAVRKAEKDGVTVELLESEDAVREFYELQCQTRKRHGLPPQPFRFFQNIGRHILSTQQGVVCLARYRGEAVAGAMFFFLGGRAVFKYGASDQRWQQLRPNNLVMWTAIQWLVRHGCTSLSLGKTGLEHAGLRRFKLNLGAAEEPVEYVKFDLRASRFVVETDGVTGWHNWVFQSLPIALSRSAGELLYRHWA
ncbi:MAG TPA: GNAT family N-acetyltransferase, partial [Verrucomicrobiae bacterium]